MPAPNTITIDKLARPIGTPKCPVLVDVRTDGDFQDDPNLIPSAVRRQSAEVETWARSLNGRASIVLCHNGLELSQGTAAYLRHQGVPAEVLENGFKAWRESALPVVPHERFSRATATGGQSG